MSEIRVHLAGYPHLTGTLLTDPYADKVTVKWDEGRTLEVFADRVAYEPAEVSYLEYATED